jgi:hypothetical protein
MKRSIICNELIYGSRKDYNSRNRSGEKDRMVINKKTFINNIEKWERYQKINTSYRDIAK